jgi:hypothetical protein
LAEEETPPPDDAPRPPEPPVDEPDAGPAPQPSAEQLADIAQQIQAIPIDFFLVSTVSTLASIAYARLGETKLDDARVAIDAMRALIPVLEGRLEPAMKRDFEQALANLQLAYADASARA